MNELKEAIKQIMEDNKDATPEKIYSLLTMMRIVERSKESFDNVSQMINEIKEGKPEKMGDADMIAMLKQPSNIRNIISESKQSEEGKDLLKGIINLIETKGDEVKSKIGDQNFYIVKTEIASNMGMLNEMKKENDDLSEEIYWHHHKK